MSSFEVIKGKNNIMISAPHAVEQTREDKIKFAEKQTKYILQYLCSACGCHGMYKTINDNDDANWDSTCSYKKFLVDYVKKNKIEFLLDLHQLSPVREEEIDIGTGFGKNIFYKKNLLNIFIRCFEETGLIVKSDYLFAAEFEHTVAATIARECKIPAFQVEINSKLLMQENAEYNFEGIATSLIAFIKFLEEKN